MVKLQTGPQNGHRLIQKDFYSLKLRRDLLLAISSTCAGPPTRIVPWMKIATKPDNMTTIWNTSVQITALMPPCTQTLEEKETWNDESNPVLHIQGENMLPSEKPQARI